MIKQIENVPNRRTKRPRAGWPELFLQVDRSLLMLTRHFDSCLRVLNEPQRRIRPAGARTSPLDNITPRNFNPSGN